MNFKKTWKRFFTVSRASEGFTLVELIVVIAILAILAGIAVPAYSGYIKKANKAADLQLLGAVNTAFAAACLENGKDVSTLPNGAVAFSIDNMLPSLYRAEFQRYFAGNTASFQTITGLAFINGAFAESERLNFTYAGTGANIVIDSGTISLLNASSFGSLGAPGLLGQVNMVSGFAQGLVDSGSAGAFNNIINSPEYLASFAGMLGIDSEDTEGLSADEIRELCVDRSEELGWTDDQFNSAIINAAVLNAAENTVGQNSDDILTLLQSGNAKSQIAGNSDTGAQLSQAALAYGMYTAFANSEEYGNETLRANTENPITVLNDLNNEDFLEYLSTTQASTDLQAYMAALGTVNNAASDTTTAQHVLVNGFNNSALVDLLQNAMGSASAE